MLSEIINWVLTFGRNRAEDKRNKIIILSDELDKLADLMEKVLEVTTPDGAIQESKIIELEQLRRRVWNRWTFILESKGYREQSVIVKTEVEACIRVAHAAPGVYVEEIHLIQIGLANGFIDKKIRQRFERCIDRIRDVTTKMRLNS